MKQRFSTLFLLMATVFTVCLIASNLFATKVFTLGAGINLPGAVVIFPLSYILGDCMTEVWGYRKARLVIWLAFACNLAVALVGQLVTLLPAAPFWEGGEHFNFVFSMAPRVTLASLLAFLAGSTLNALVMSRMKVADQGRRFGVRAVVSSVAGELLDSLIFLPIAFLGTPWRILGTMMLVQVGFKVLYEIAGLPLTSLVIRKVKAVEAEDVYDEGISYNPFKLFDIQ